MLHYKKDGTLDMRYKSSKQYMSNNGGSSKETKGGKSSLLSFFGTVMDFAKTVSDIGESFQQLGSSFDQVNIRQPRESYFIIINGKVKSDCLAAKNGDVKFTAPGVIDKRSKAIKSGKLRLLENGLVDPDCEAYKSQEYVYQRRIFTEEIRDRSKQRAFRRANNMFGNSYEASHVVDLEVATEIMPDLVPSTTKITDLTNQLRVLNDPELLLKESYNQNRVINHDIAKQIINLHKGITNTATPEVKERLLKMVDGIDSLERYRKNDAVIKLRNRLEELSRK